MATSGVLARFDDDPLLLPFRNPCELRGLCRHSYFGPRTFGGGITSLMKQNKKAEICFVIYIAGFFFKKILL